MTNTVCYGSLSSLITTSPPFLINVRELSLLWRLNLEVPVAPLMATLPKFRGTSAVTGRRKRTSNDWFVWESAPFLTRMCSRQLKGDTMNATRLDTWITTLLQSHLQMILDSLFLPLGDLSDLCQAPHREGRMRESRSFSIRDT